MRHIERIFLPVASIFTNQQFVENPYASTFFIMIRMSMPDSLSFNVRFGDKTGMVGGQPIRAYHDLR
ncbi:MAG: hypothetical protein IPJ13_25965 [Saprospiraceae bacterium]|nr:hypothetical protein [Saprospiraceae bacterium]